MFETKNGNYCNGCNEWSNHANDSGLPKNAIDLAPAHKYSLLLFLNYVFGRAVQNKPDPKIRFGTENYPTRKM